MLLGELKTLKDPRGHPFVTPLIHPEPQDFPMVPCDNVVDDVVVFFLVSFCCKTTLTTSALLAVQRGWSTDHSLERAMDEMEQRHMGFISTPS